ncbi:MAG TPA: glycosyltransferase family 2 protein [Bacteroidia bacterium]|nr:glycosyltransferase family 2 protein [Bacteroidia bacterium]
MAGIDVSIIIVNYNTFRLTRKCISTIVQHTKGVSYEIILVDNASVECDPDKFLKEFPAVKLVRSSENLGFTGGNNLGIGMAKGQYILLLNSDTELTEDSISKCYDVIKVNSKMGVVTCKLVSPNGEIQKQCHRFPSVALTLIELFRIHKLIPQPKRGILMGNGFFDHLSSIYTEFVWGAFFMFPTDILQKFTDKKLPGRFFMYSEDLEWCYTIKELGYTIYYNADTSIIHHLGASSKASFLRLKHNNEYAFIVKHYGWFYAKMLLLVRIILYTSKGRRVEYAAEIAGVFRTLFFTGKA